MLKIGEFSKLSRISVRMLRHYDEIGLLKPAEIYCFKAILAVHRPGFMVFYQQEQRRGA